MAISDTSLALGSNQLDAIADAVAVPTYDRDQLRRSIVHIGVGGFHRAHLATYIDELCSSGNTNWSIVGAGVMAGDHRIADALGAQDHLYTLVSRGANETDVRVIGSIVDFVLAADDATALIDLIATDDVQIVSLTITEGGYPIDDSSGTFRADLCTPGSVFEILARGLDARRRRSGRPLTILSCDNIMTNGAVAREAAIGAARGIDHALPGWIADHVSFPNSMVDRITPMTTPGDIEWLDRTMGIADRWPVVAEPFRQWVVEDNFAGDRLPLDDIDVIVTNDIEPYELTKLRLLNAGHSCLAYLAALDGFTAVDSAMADPVLSRFVRVLLDVEAKPTLPAADGIVLDDYIDSLIERFSNPAVGDQIERLCLDGSAKFPKFLLPTIQHQLDHGGPIELATLALAGWCQYLADPNRTPASDPLLASAVEHARNSNESPVAFLDFDAVFGPELSGSHRFRTAFTAALTALRDAGVQSTVLHTVERAESANGRHH